MMWLNKETGNKVAQCDDSNGKPPCQSSVASSRRNPHRCVLPVTEVGLRICHGGSLCRVVQDGWITGDILTLQFGAQPWVHVTGWTNSLRISFLCLFHPDIQFSATRSHWSLYTPKRAHRAKTEAGIINIRKKEKKRKYHSLLISY